MLFRSTCKPSESELTWADPCLPLGIDPDPSRRRRPGVPRSKVPCSCNHFRCRAVDSDWNFHKPARARERTTATATAASCCLDKLTLRTIPPGRPLVRDLDRPTIINARAILPTSLVGDIPPSQTTLAGTIPPELTAVVAKTPKHWTFRPPRLPRGRDKTRQARCASRLGLLSTYQKGSSTV